MGGKRPAENYTHEVCAAGAPVSVVVATRDRWTSLARTLDRLHRLSAAHPVIVVDNASSDGTPARVRAGFPAVTVVALPANIGAAARTAGARLATTPYVAFADDDSWWDDGALGRASDALTADPAVGLVAARVLVGEAADLDPVSALMGAGPLDEWYRHSAAGRRGVTGFLACAAVVRRHAFLAVGGFEPALMIGGEEELVALDLADGGWKLVYDPDVVVRHHPSPQRDEGHRRELLARNSLITAGLRYSPGVGFRRSRARVAEDRRCGLRAIAATGRSAPWLVGHRRRVRPAVERAFVGVTGHDT